VTESLLLNGVPLRTVGPGLLRATSYGHFTSMQVRDGRVDGLDLHFERLDRTDLHLPSAGFCSAVDNLGTLGPPAEEFLAGLVLG
jgi:hypothetical protein